MKKFGPIAAIASGLGGYLLLAILSSSPSWFDDSDSKAAEEKKTRAPLEVSVSDDVRADSPNKIIRKTTSDGERS